MSPFIRPQREKENPEEKVLVNFNRSRYLFAVVVLILLGRPAVAQVGQDRFRVGTGLGVEKIRLAVADFGPRGDSAKTHAAQFTQVVRDDLAFSGVLELVSPSFYPTQVPTAPNELQAAAWTDPQVKANFVAFGNLTESSSEVAIQGWLYDVTSPSSQAVI